MQLIMEMLGDDNTSIHNDVINEGHQPSYYEGKALNILNQLTNTDNYFYFLMTILKDYHKLNKEQQKKIKNKMNIEPEIVIKERIIQKKGNSKKNKKPRLNNHDDLY